MSTYFNTQVGKEIGYDLQFHTEDKEKYEFMQEAARRCIDNEIVLFTDFAPVIHAHWIKGPLNDYCSHCGASGNRGNYCHYCGAKMDEKEKE